MTNIASSKENKYIWKPIMVTRAKIRGTDRLKDTTNEMSLCILCKLKTKCLMGKCEEGQPELLRNTKA